MIPQYLAALQQELRFHSHDPVTGTSPLDTLFLGGGTPTHPPAPALRSLFSALAERFEWTARSEVSVEANPLDLNDEKLTVLVDAGVNRISLGAQGFDEAALQLLERDHHAEDVETAVRRCQQRLENVALDLIFGVPGQSLADWRTALRRAVDLGVTHLSTYGLTFEKGTAFWTRQQRGELQATPEDLEYEMYAAAMDDLAAAGFEHYELSNFARPGFRCRHNQVYWRGEEYFAYGPGAARYIEGRRETNIRSTLGWLARLQRGLSPVAETEALDPEARAREQIFVGLRTSDGIDRADFEERTGFPLSVIAEPALSQQIAAGLIEDDGHALRLTRAGKFLANRVVAEFL